MSKADVLVVTPTQFGEGNLRNLEAAEIALEKGNPQFSWKMDQSKRETSPTVKPQNTLRNSKTKAP